MSDKKLKCSDDLIIDFNKPKVMGIINITPDSFSGDGVLSPDEALDNALEMVDEGADIIDIGGQSTRPGCTKIDYKEELSRVIPAIKKIAHNISVPLSVDTFYPEVAKQAVFYGARIINDVSGEITVPMCNLVAQNKCSWIITSTKNIGGFNPLNEVYDDLLRISDSAIKNGVDPMQLCLDPGFGFGKSQAQCISLLENIGEITSKIDYPFLIGVSRKRMIKYITKSEDLKILDKKTAEMSAASTLNGVDIVRVHNVKETVKELNKLYG